MDKENKRAQRRKNEQTIWLKRLNREFNNDGRHYVNKGEKSCIKNLKYAQIPEDLKNSKYGMMLKHTSKPEPKNYWDSYYNHKLNKQIRQENKMISNNEYKEYIMGKNDSKYLIEQLQNINSEIKRTEDFICEETILLNNAKKRLKVLNEKRIKTEMDLCWVRTYVR